MNSTPDSRDHHTNDFGNTRKALDELLDSLKCQHCHEDTVDIYHLGNCDHSFCRSCAEPKVGKSCPICGMMPDAKKAKVDLQLSNVASLCHQMVQLFDDDTINARTEENVSTCPSQKKKDPKYTKTVSLHTTKEMQTEKRKKTRSRSSLKNSSNPINFERKKEEDRKSADSPLECFKLQQDQENIQKQRRLNNDKESLKPNERSKKAQPSESVKHHEKGHLKINSKSVETKRKGRTAKPSMTPKSLSENGTPKTLGANLSKRNAKGETSLQVATIKADFDNVKTLLEAGANPNVKDNAGWTPLHEAVNHGSVDIAAILIVNGASVNAPGFENDTPLHDAVSNNRCECVQLLISKGASIYSRNSHGQTPLDTAQTDEMKQLLLSRSLNADNIGADDQLMLEESNKTVCLLTSKLEKDAHLLLAEFQKLFDCKSVENFSSDVTHLITGADSEGLPLRTMKYLSSILCGMWIVSSEWLQASVDEKRIVPEKAFVVPSSRMCPDASLKAVENRLKQLPKLFDGCQFYLYSKFPFSSLQRDQIAELIKLGGGVILSREPRLHNLDDYPYTRPYHAQNSNSLADCTIYKIYDSACSDPPSVQSQRMSCLPLSWLVDSISAFSLLEKSAYIH